MDIKASDVKALREKTGAGMMECKNALVETKGDAAAAEKLLKEKGLAAVEKRTGRATSVITSYSIHYTKLYDVRGRARRSGTQRP